MISYSFMSLSDFFHWAQCLLRCTGNFQRGHLWRVELGAKVGRWAGGFSLYPSVWVWDKHIVFKWDKNHTQNKTPTVCFHLVNTQVLGKSPYPGFQCKWYFSSVQFSHSVLSDSLRPYGTAARQVSLSITHSRSLLKLMSIESVMPSNHLILCHPLLLLPSIFPIMGFFSNELALRIRSPKYFGHQISLCTTFILSKLFYGFHIFMEGWWVTLISLPFPLCLSLLCFIYVIKNNESLKTEPKHYLISETYTVSRCHSAREWSSLICRNVSFFKKCKISPQSGLSFCIYHYNWPQPHPNPGASQELM